MNIPSDPSPARGHSSFGQVPIQLDAVAVGIAEVQRLGDTVVGRAVELDAPLDQPAQRVRQARAIRVANRRVVQTGVPWDGACRRAIPRC